MAKVHLGNPYRVAPAPITGGEPLNRTMGNYAKNAPSVPSAVPFLKVALGSLFPLADKPRKGGPAMIRGIKGGVGPQRGIKSGGIGPGKLGGYGSSRHYDKKPYGEG